MTRIKRGFWEERERERNPRREKNGEVSRQGFGFLGERGFSSLNCGDSNSTTASHFTADSLTRFLHGLPHSFDVIGVSPTWRMMGRHDCVDSWKLIGGWGESGCYAGETVLFLLPLWWGRALVESWKP